MKFRTITDSRLAKYNDMDCEIIRPLTDKECDIEEVGQMYFIRLSNGKIIDVFEDEIVK